MKELKWSDHDLYLHVCRIHYIQKLKNKTRTSICPECESVILQDKWGEEYCMKCGLVTRATYDYVAGFKIDLPYGLK